MLQIPIPKNHLLSGDARQRGSPEHLAAAVVAARSFPQGHAARPPPGSDGRHFVFRAGQPGLRVVLLVLRPAPLREDAALGAAESQQAARHPHRARQQRPEGRGQRLESGQRHQPHRAGEEQDEQAAAEPRGAPQQGERRHRAQRGQQPARRQPRLAGGEGLLSASLCGRQPPQRHQVPRVAADGQRQQPPARRAALPAGQAAGEEEEGAGDAEERAEAAGEAQQGVQRPRAPPASAVLRARAAPAGEGQQREGDGGQGAQAEQRPAGGGGGGGGAGAERRGREALREVPPQRGRAAPHVAVPEALGQRRRGRRPRAVRLRAVRRRRLAGAAAGDGGGRFSLFPHGGRGSR